MSEINSKEIRIVGLQRSGMHSIINWIILQHPGFVCFLNDVSPKRNPFLTTKSDIKYNSFIGKFRNGSIEWNKPGDKPLLDLEREKSGQLSKKDCLIYNYEDRYFKDVFTKDFEKNHDRWVGKSLKRYDILIHRDAFNFFASRLKWMDYHSRDLRNSLNNAENRDILINLWKAYAAEYMGETNHLTNNKIVINYNLWFSSTKYRKSLAKRLQLEFTDKGTGCISDIGFGSSFDGEKFNGKASEMKVLERWKKFEDNQFYRDIFKDKKLIEISNKIFGEIPGTKKLNAE